MSIALILVAAWFAYGSLAAVFVYGKQSKPGKAAITALIGATCVTIVLMAAFGGVTP